MTTTHNQAIARPRPPFFVGDNVTHKDRPGQTGRIIRKEGPRWLVEWNHNGVRQQLAYTTAQLLLIEVAK